MLNYLMSIKFKPFLFFIKNTNQKIIIFLKNFQIKKVS